MALRSSSARASLVTNWENETRKFTPELKTLVLEGAGRAARFKSIADVDIVITSYALLRRDIDTLREINFSTAVLDEAQHIKNPETQNAQAAFALRAKHRFVLTGTPMENSVRDLWSIMNFALPGYLGDRNDFRERYELPIARGSAPDVQRRLSRRLQPFLLRRKKRDVAKDLPEKIEQVVPCSLTSHQRAAYDALLREIQQGLGSSSKNVNAGAQRMKMLTGLLRLRQVCCDLRLVGIDKEETSAKLDLLDELLEEAIDGEHRVLVFSQFVSMLHAGYVEQTARELGSAVADRREALKKFITGRDASPDAKTKLGPLAERLREYQLVGFEWLTRLAANNLGGILADEMGLGKTVQTLAFLRAQQGDGPALVVCPTSLVTNWENEARKFTPELKTLVLEGADRAARFKSIADVDMVITSYALLRRDIDTLREINFSTVVLDEAQHIKNPETQNAQAAFALRAKHRFVLTGTPMENSVRDLWSIMNFALPGYLGNRNDFRERYELPIARGSAPDVQRRLSRRLQPFLLRRRKRDVAKDLPEKIEQVVPCSLTSHQRAAYDALLREIQQGLGSSGKNVNAGAQRMKMLTGLLRLRQVCCDLRLVGIDKEETSAKLDLLDELLEEAIDGEHRVLVFSQFVSMLHLIRERLEKLEIPFCYLDGSTKQRQEIVDRFQSDSAIPVFLISLKAGGVGLNLSAADTVIHFDPWWNPAVEAQATDRAHRIGQTRVVTAYKLITRDTVEDKILRLQEKKRAAIDAAIDSEEPLMTGLTTEELEELLA